MRAIAPELVERFRRDLLSLAGRPEPLGLAVSGGPDSLALLLLAQAAFPEGVQAATVDHRLRAESRAEAEFVAGICGELKVPHAVLPIEVDIGRASVQRAAREARYVALDAWLATNGIRLLLTAHHADDQAETLVMRLLRGAGVGGLSAVRAAAPLPAPGSDAMVLRPLLAWRKEELRALVEAAGIVPIDDPSNLDDRYDRVRIRRRLASAEWVDPLPLARSAAALADADAALSWTADRLWAERVAQDGEAWLLDPAGIPAELTRRLVLKLLARLGSAAAKPRGEEVVRLIARLEKGSVATLFGVKCRGGERWRFETEASRRRSRVIRPRSRQKRFATRDNPRNRLDWIRPNGASHSRTGPPPRQADVQTLALDCH